MSRQNTNSAMYLLAFTVTILVACIDIPEIEPPGDFGPSSDVGDIPVGTDVIGDVPADTAAPDDGGFDTQRPDSIGDIDDTGDTSDTGDKDVVEDTDVCEDLCDVVGVDVDWREVLDVDSADADAYIEDVPPWDPGPCSIDEPCNDGNGCTVDDYWTNECECVGQLVQGCNDGLSCTVDSCETTETCTHDLKAGFCLITGSCVAEGTAGGNVCLVCDPSRAVNDWSIALDTTPCSDDDACTGGDHCSGIDDTCLPGTVVDPAILCDDENPCTTDLCDQTDGCWHQNLNGGVCAEAHCEGLTHYQASECVTGQCPTPQQTSCDDADGCTVDTCDAATGCSNVALDCDDDNVCTEDGCNSLTGCWHEDMEIVCHPAYCDGLVQYPEVMCVYGDCGEQIPVDCDDGNSCTTDTCDPYVACQNTALDDGTACGAAKACFSNWCLDFECPDNFVLIPAGTFEMGSPPEEPGHMANESPVHTVNITAPLCMSMTETTRAMWKGLFATQPWTSACEGDSCPVDRVSWFDSAGFALAWSQSAGLQPCYTFEGCDLAVPGTGPSCSGASIVGRDCEGYRLPTEAEWEYSARAGTTTATYNGPLDEYQLACESPHDVLDPVAWFCGNSSSAVKPVAGKLENAFDLFDMHGNTAEWVEGTPDSYPQDSQTDPGIFVSGVSMVARGGSALTTATYSRSAYRWSRTAVQVPGGGVGFRLVLPANPCMDGLECTSEGVLPSTGACWKTTDAGYCVIEGTCWVDGTPNPSNPCEACVAEMNPAGWSPVDEGTACDDNSACTVGTTCNSGLCLGSTITCNDGNQCTSDECDPGAVGGDPCVYTPVADETTCSDPSDVCLINGKCVDGVCEGDTNDCDDANPCTDDWCHARNGCGHSNNDFACDDGDFCTLGDTCEDGDCVPGSPKDCSDGLVCTADHCDSDDSHGGAAEDPCWYGPAPTGTSCDDGDPCTVGEMCSGTDCAGGAEYNCDDYDPCTTDWCEDNAGSADCQHSDVDPAVYCDDDNPCTRDECEPYMGCMNIADVDGVSCGDGAYCWSGWCKEYECPDGWSMIPAGSFNMGAYDTEVGSASRANERPVHIVQISRPFCASATEISQFDYSKYVDWYGTGSCSAGLMNCAAQSISWYDAVYWCNSLSRDEGRDVCAVMDGCVGEPGLSLECADVQLSVGLDCSGYRLPTEAEWEYMTRADTSLATYNGNIPADAQVCEQPNTTLDSIAWFCGNSGMNQQAMGTLDPNPWGLYDSLGNVIEWVWDFYGPYSMSFQKDPLGSATGIYRVTRGAEVASNAGEVRAAWRELAEPMGSNVSAGFRPVMTAKPCDDGLICTTDTVAESNGECVHEIADGWCLINDICFEDGDISEENSCQSCNSDYADDDWTVLGDGVACVDDGNSCTNDVCSFGACEHPTKGSGSQCEDDGLLCTSDTCVSGSCTHSVAYGCLIDGDCHDESAVNPENDCQICRSASTKTAWSFQTDGSLCDDGFYCTSGESCVSGACALGTALGTMTWCEDQSTDCLTFTCDDVADTCTRDVLADFTACEDDSDTCTNDVCKSGVCEHPEIDNDCGARECGPSSSGCFGCGECGVGFGCDETGSCSDKCAGVVCPECQACSDGACVSANEGSSCTSDGNQCTRDVCSAGSCEHPALAENTLCNDGNACTALDQCKSGVCTGNSPVVCNAQDVCHVAGVCDPATGTCSNPAKPDTTPCTGDMNDCTEDQCFSGLCEHRPLSDGVNCDDGNLCTTTDQCYAGNCVGSGQIECPSPAECHIQGTCNPGTGICSDPLESDGVGCSDDGNSCTRNECLSGVCSPQARSDGATCTSDDYSCTADVCSSGVCVHNIGAGCLIGGVCWAEGTVNPANECLACDHSQPEIWSSAPRDAMVCEDGKFCTINDSCTGGVCLSGSARDCSSYANSCNDGVCNEALDRCASNPLPDATECDEDGNQCTDDECSAGICVHPAVPDSTICDDSDACTVGDSCFMGGCVSGEQIECPSPADCHLQGTCDPMTGLCNDPLEPDLAVCDDDGNDCTLDVCANGSCTHPNADDTTACASDGLSCTADECDGGTCNHVLNPSYCLIGGACHLDADLNPANECQVCDKLDPDNWSSVSDGTSCDDYQYCTVADVCYAGSCVAGALRDCSVPSDLCNSYECSESGNTCVATPLPAGTACEGDGLECTVDICSAGSCTHPSVPNDCDERVCGPSPSGCYDCGNCPDGYGCDDTGQCSDLCADVVCPECQACVAGACQSANEGGVCGDDGNECTSDRCSSGSCVHPAQSDGLACNSDSNECTVDHCSSGVCSHSRKADGTTCTADTNECTSDYCQAGECSHPPVSDGIACTSDGLPCTTDACVSGTCSHNNVADGTVCMSDGLSCTNDVCTSGACVHPISTGCLIDGLCIAEGVLNPENSCEKCRGSLNRTDWTVLIDLSSCNDGLYCTVGDKCYSGTCTSSTPRDCSNPSDLCNSYSCDEVADVCASTPVVDGTVCESDSNECTVDVCITGSCAHPNVNNGTSCTDDGAECTDDVCLAGSCIHPNRTNGTTCSGDGYECTVDYCSSGACVHNTLVSGCMMDGACWEDGDIATDPAWNGCAWCDSDVDEWDWSPRPEGASCPDDGNLCTTDTCNGGWDCLHTPVVPGVYCDDSNFCTDDFCDPTTGCYHESKPDGTFCGDDPGAPDRFCFAGWCKAYECPKGYVMVPAGEFVMGARSTEPGIGDGERPQHDVTLTKPFCMKQTEVTNEEWYDIFGNYTSGSYSSCGLDCPADTASWWDAAAYAHYVSTSAGVEECYVFNTCTGAPGLAYSCLSISFSGLGCHGFRLPTEAEWEWASRAYTTTDTYNGDIGYETYCTPNPVLIPIAWYCKNSGGYLQKIEQLNPNQFRLYDMLGSVAEWVWDWYGKNYYSSVSGGVTDPIGPATPSVPKTRIVRGGHYDAYAKVVRSSAKLPLLATRDTVETGIRPVITANPCDDGLVCTTDYVDPSDGSCDATYNTALNYCLINEMACFGDGQLNPLNDCEACDVSTDTFSWTNLPYGTACTSGGTYCKDGSCL